MGMRGLRRLVLAFACAVGVAASAAAMASVASAGPKAPSAPDASNGSVDGWRVAATIYPPGPHPAKGTRVFMSGLSAPGASDVWAIGGTITASDQSFPVLEHWDGRTWKYVAMPRSFAGVPFEPYQVAASSLADVWVFDPSTGAAGRWAHWNGRSWTTGRLPAIPVAGDDSPQVTITAAAAGHGDAWVGGTVSDWQTESGLPAVAFLAGYDGHAWRTFRIPKSMPNIVGISALSRTDVWAAATGGQGTSAVASASSDENVLLHWNGGSWKSIPVPPKINVSAVVGESARSAWVTGDVPGKGPDGLTFVAGAAHWNGTRWTITPDPAADADFRQVDDVDELTSATADGRGGLWAVAEGYPPLVGSLPGQASLWHYANGRWTGVQLGRLGDPDLFQIAGAPGTASLWAVGTFVTAASPGYPRYGAILRYVSPG